MGKKSKSVTTFDFEEKKEEPKVDLISLNEFLSKHNGQRSLDKIIKGWYFKKDTLNTKRSIEEWSKLIAEFHNETER